MLCIVVPFASSSTSLLITTGKTCTQHKLVGLVSVAKCLEHNMQVNITYYVLHKRA